MKQRQRCVHFFAVLLAAGPLAHGQFRSDGGRDVSIALFSNRQVQRVSVTPLGAEAWIARCSTCSHQPLRAPLSVAAPTDLFGGGPLRITDAASGTERATRGLWHLRGRTASDGLDITVQVPSERYVAAVLNAETLPGEPAASLRALAIVARTYTLNGSHYAPAPGHLPADLCDSTACQAVRFGAVPSAIREAVAATAGEILWFGHQRAQVFFSQHCGGITETGAAMSPKLADFSYLPTHPDPFCLRHGAAAWHADVSAHDLARIANDQGWHVPSPLAAAYISRRSVSDRALEVTFKGTDGRTGSVPAVSLRLALGRALGWNLVRSDLYQLELRDGALVFDGRGHGHGVGLCQTGASEMATEGKDARAILRFYFPGTHVGINFNDQGWQEVAIDPLRVRSAQPIPPSQQSALQQAWLTAAYLLPITKQLRPTVIFSPSSELFRQNTEQPGWNLASTSGNTTVLQPLAVLAKNGSSLQPLLLHEFLHMRVEAEAGDRAPLWLREGLVEALAGGASSSSPGLSLEAIETGLREPLTHAEAQKAHSAAAATVSRLLKRYGLSAIRGWLAAGVPPGVV